MLKDTNIQKLAGRDTTDFVGYNVNFEGIQVKNIIFPLILNIRLLILIILTIKILNYNYNLLQNEKVIGKITPRLQEFYVPSKGQDDVETAFYSPISSKSVSPEPAIPTIFNDRKYLPIKITQRTH